MTSRNFVRLGRGSKQLHQSVRSFIFHIIFSPKLFERGSNGNKPSSVSQRSQSLSIVQAQIRKRAASISLHLSMVCVARHACNLEKE
jgi:hypothetical protein